LAWQHEMTQAVSVIKSTAELLVDDSNGISEEKRLLIWLVAKEAKLAARLLSRQDITSRWSPNQPWPLTPIDALEWVRFLAYRAEELLKIKLEIDAAEHVGQISVDMHHLTCALLFILSKVEQLAKVVSIDGRLYAKESWIYLDLSWEGAAVDTDNLSRWKQSIPKLKDIELTIPLIEMLVVHGAKLWILPDDTKSGKSGLRFLIPMIEGAEIVMVDGLTTVLPDSRPEFYDFDLFKSNLQNTGLNDRLLTELTFTVFDTETTGLDPQGGDEIISIGAVRIVNGRLLQNEKFDQLVNPGRTLPWASIKFHGIRPEMLVNQPPIDKVLPRFHAFVQDTVIVGHNVAFDMRMLQMKESQTNIIFTNPILDTMLLSDVVHPAHQKHNLQAVSERLGVRIMGRHTALGDATATGEIFLRLIPLLAAQGIRTFQEASQASQKSLYARLKY
jgi:DNA polymerase-3 subunit epsilon